MDSAGGNTCSRKYRLPRCCVLRSKVADWFQLTSVVFSLSCQRSMRILGEDPKLAPQTFTRIHSHEQIWGWASMLMLTWDGTPQREFCTRNEWIWNSGSYSAVNRPCVLGNWFCLLDLTQFPSTSNRDKSRISPRSPASLTFSDTSCWWNIKRGLSRTSMVFEINLRTPPRCTMIAFMVDSSPRVWGKWAQKLKCSLGLGRVGERTQASATTQGNPCKEWNALPRCYTEFKGRKATPMFGAEGILFKERQTFSEVKKLDQTAS